MNSNFADLKTPTPYWRKFEKLDLSNFEWNIPEQENGSFLIIGGSATHFSLPIHLAEFLASNYPIANLHLILPDVLSSKLPKDPRFIFTASTSSGSLDKDPAINQAVTSNDATFICGDLSKNNITAAALQQAIPKEGHAPILLTRDAVDLVAAEAIDYPRLLLVASMPQLQKLFRTLYYPKVLTLTMPIFQVVEALHKFTLSYPAEILTLHDNQIIAARAGIVKSLPLTATDYTPLTLWQGQLAVKYLALSLYNPAGLIDKN